MLLFLLTLLYILFTSSSRSWSQIPSKIYACTGVITVSQVLLSESIKLASVKATQAGTSKIIIDRVISVHKSFWPLCTSRTALFIQSCFSSRNLHWLLGSQQVPHRYPWVSKKSLFSLLWSLPVYLFSAFLRIPWSLLATYISSCSFFSPLPFVFWKHPQTEEYALIYVSTKGMVSCWSVLHLFMATRCAIHCTEEGPKIEAIHLNRWCLQCGFFPIQKENPFLFVMG